MTAYELLSGVAAQVTALALVGPVLCRNKEWLQLSIQTTFAIFGAAHAIRDNYSPRWRWLAHWWNDAPKQIRAMRARAVELLTPLYKERVDALKKSDNNTTSAFSDCVHWLLKLKGAEKAIERIADQQLFLTVASIHTTSSTLTSTLFDLITHPEYHTEIMEHIAEALVESNGHWTLQHVAQMRKLDSFMKESQRMNPIGFSKLNVFFFFFLPHYRGEECRMKLFNFCPLIQSPLNAWP